MQAMVTTNPNPTNGTYVDGTVVALTATPNTGYQFDGWSGDASGTTNPINITMDSDKTVTAIFSLIPVQYTLTINANNGTVATNPNPTNGTYVDGTVVALTATPAAGYQFVGWSGDATGTTNPLNITMNSNKIITAIFDITAGIEDFNKINFRIYPNPTTSVLNIEMKSNLKQAVIYSVLGAEVLKTTSKTINTSSLQPGVYLIKIEDEIGNTVAKRFMK